MPRLSSPRLVSQSRSKGLLGNRGGGGPRAILKGKQANAITGTGGERERQEERERRGW